MNTGLSSKVESLVTHGKVLKTQIAQIPFAT